MNKALFILCALVITLGFSLCCHVLDRQGVARRHWKFSEGYHIADILRFDDGTYILSKNMEVYKQGVKMGHVVRATGHELVLESADTAKERGRYVCYGFTE